MNSFLQTLLKNWKTSFVGLSMMVGGIVHIIFAARARSLTEQDCTTTLLAVITGFGFIAAGDAGATTPKAPPLDENKK